MPTGDEGLDAFWDQMMEIAQMDMLQQGVAITPLHDAMKEAGVNITLTQLREALKRAGQTRIMDPEAKALKDRVEISRTSHASTARLFLQTYNDKTLQLRSYKGELYSWNGRWWQIADSDHVMVDLRDWLDRDCRTFDAKGLPMLVDPDNALLAEVMAALRAVTTVRKADMPPTGSISARNGILDLATGDLTPHTPDLFIVNGIDADWNPEPGAWKGSQFVGFIEGAVGEDQSQVLLVQEMLGYVLTPDTSMQKAFAIIGPKRSGKGTLGRVMARLLGSAYGGSSAAQLGSRFGLWPHIDRHVLTIPDMRVEARDGARSMISEMILSIVGEDEQTIDRKRVAPWTGYLPIRFLIMSNVMPNLSDPSGVVASRFMFLHFPKSHYGKEDRTLTDRLTTEAELSAALSFAVEGWRRLQAQGHFTETETHVRMLRDAELKLNPARYFIETCIEITGQPHDVVTKTDLYQAYTGWCEDNHVSPLNRDNFFRVLEGMNLQGVTTTRPRMKRTTPLGETEERVWMTAGIKLKPRE